MWNSANCNAPIVNQGMAPSVQEIHFADLWLGETQGIDMSTSCVLQVMRRSGRQQGTISFELHLQESPSLLAIQEMIPKSSPTPIIRSFPASAEQIQEYDQHQQEQPARFQPHNNYGYGQERTPQNIAGDKFSRNDVVAPQNRRSTLANGLYPSTAPKNRVYASQPAHDLRQEETSLLDSYFEIDQKSL